MGNEINKIDETAETIKETKQKGICPFCNEVVAPVVMEKNRIGRDRCVCPNCKESVYECRTPSCHNYAKGTRTYDHELCVECEKSVKKAGVIIGSTLLGIAKIVFTAWATDKVSKSKRK